MKLFLSLLGLLGTLLAAGAAGPPALDPVVQRPWYETRTAHCRVFSCGPAAEVARVAARLEQFREAYGTMAGAQAVASPPIVVMVYPDVKSMRPFLPIYNGNPANLAGFFKRAPDENLIVLALGPGEQSLDVIFHEYAHLLLRRNDRVWPLWLKEGMAEVYSTFRANGRQIQIGAPIEHHLNLLANRPFLPLAEVFAVRHDSPDYNERERQGVFYAESWLLTHYLFCGDVPARKAKFSQIMALLHEGRRPEAAFTATFQTTLPAMEKELHGYLARGRFGAFNAVLPQNLSAPRAQAHRPLARGEICFHLGNQLARLERYEEAEFYFRQTRLLAPKVPLAAEGLGLLAVMKHQDADAAALFKDALDHGSTNFLAHYWYAKSRYELTSDGHDRYTTLNQEMAGEIRAELVQSVTLMPDFSAAHNLLGFLELVQGDFTAAELHLGRACQLEPENEWYLLPLAQAQLAKKDAAAARQTLAPLLQPHTDEKIRARAEDLLRGARQP